ncbi:MAG: methyltransferase [Candidatus Marinimicrobia bacterium]|nr:methyltransferase [Candidatus Neomarinimicrobiota bacterium]
MEDIKNCRIQYANEIKYVSNIQSESIIDAFAKVPRENFLGPGPWEILDVFARKYWSTKDNDPRHLYHNILVAIDKERSLNNGQPSLWALLFDKLMLKEGEKIIHIGCGTGYYSAILSEIVGDSGHVTAIEIDGSISDLAEQNLSYKSNIKVIRTNGVEYFEENTDVIVVNAGVSRISARWLESLVLGGCLLLPLTSSEGLGWFVKITKLNKGYLANAICQTKIFHCEGGRDADADLLVEEAFKKEHIRCIKSLRLEPHDAHESCYLHGNNYCFSKLEIQTS